MILHRTRRRSRKKFTYIQRDTHLQIMATNKEKLKVIEHTPMTAMRITGTMTTTTTPHTHHVQKAKAENRKG